MFKESPISSRSSSYLSFKKYTFCKSNFQVLRLQTFVFVVLLFEASPCSAFSLASFSSFYCTNKYYIIIIGSRFYIDFSKHTNRFSSKNFSLAASNAMRCFSRAISIFLIILSAVSSSTFKISRLKIFVKTLEISKI